MGLKPNAKAQVFALPHIVWLEMSTIKYVSGFEKLKKRKKKEKLIWVSKRINR